MCRVKAKIERGPIKEESVAYIETVQGTTAEVFVSSATVSRGSIPAEEVRREKGRILIELPRETTSGEWRVWVAPDQVVKA